MDDILVSSKELYERGLSIRAVAKIKHENYETMRRCLLAMGVVIRHPPSRGPGEGCINFYGYVVLRQKLDHGRGKQWLAHRLIMEMYLDRPLEPDEVVHHINGIRTDNRLANLEIMSKQDHLRLQRERRKRKSPSP